MNGWIYKLNSWEDKIQVFLIEFQIVYVDTRLSSRWNITPSPWGQTGLYDLFLNKWVWNGVKINFTVETPAKYYFCQVIKVNIISDKWYWYHIPSDMMSWEGHFTSVLFFPKIHNLRLIMRKTSGKSKLINTLQNTCPVLLRAVKIIQKKNKNKNKKTKKL